MTRPRSSLISSAKGPGVIVRPPDGVPGRRGGRPSRGGRARIQADIKTVTALGGYAATAVTAITVQNTLGVSAAWPVPADVVVAQARAVLDDIGADVVKTGMLGEAELVERVAELLDQAH